MKPSLDPLIDQWFVKNNIRTGTQRSYKVAINKYCEWTKLTPSQLIDQAEVEEDAGVRIRNRKIQSYFIGFKKILKESNVAPSTMNLYLSAIRSFYDAFDIIVPKIRNEKGDISLEKNQGKLITKDEILKFANASPPREKALIYLMALSGMAQNEARHIPIDKFLQSASESLEKNIDSYEKLFENEKNLENEILTLHIVREKVNYRHFTFIPPEATREIINYLKERVYGRNEKIRIIDNEEPLFVNNLGKELSTDSIVTNFRRLGEQVGFNKKKNAYCFWRAHSLRKYFISTIINELGDKVFADFLAGHKIDDTTRAYWIADTEKLKKRYLNILPYLSLDNIKVKDIESNEYQKLNKELERLKHENEEIKKDIGSIMSNEEFLNDYLKILKEQNEH